MFQFTPLAPPELYIHSGVMRHDPHRVPHSESPDQRLFAPLRGLIAAYHVLRRLSVPRHPPYALISLTKTGFQQITTVLCQRIHTSVWQIDIPNSYSIVKEQSGKSRKFCHTTLVEITGVEPATSGLQSRRSPSELYPNMLLCDWWA